MRGLEDRMSQGGERVLRLQRPLLSAVAVLVLLIAAAGCGYHAAGKGSQIPTEVRTIAIPAFVNQTQTYRIENLLTQAVVREFNTRTKYRITSDPGEADAVLSGTVLSTQLAPLTYDSNTGRASSGLVTVTMKVNLKTKDGRVLYENGNYVFREQYQVSGQVSSFFEEESPAMDRVSKDFARMLVSNVLEMY